MTTWTRDKQNAAWRKWYSQNAARKIAWQHRRRIDLRNWFRELKANLRCESCGETTLECLQFHHRDPTAKDLEISTAINNGWSRKRIMAELAKCMVLCANCHLKHHWNERLLSG